jgi:hypothetical protein
MPPVSILLDEGLPRPRPPMPEAAAAAAAVRADFAVRTGGHRCECPPAPILDRTPEAVLRDALDAAPAAPLTVAESVAAAIEHARAVHAAEGARYTEWLMNRGR